MQSTLISRPEGRLRAIPFAKLLFCARCHIRWQTQRNSPNSQEARSGKRREGQLSPPPADSQSAANGHERQPIGLAAHSISGGLVRRLSCLAARVFSALTLLL